MEEKFKVPPNLLLQYIVKYNCSTVSPVSYTVWFCFVALPNSYGR